MGKTYLIEDRPSLFALLINEVNIEVVQNRSFQADPTHLSHTSESLGIRINIVFLGCLFQQHVFIAVST